MLRIADVTTANFGRLQNKDSPEWRTSCPSSPFILRESAKGKGPSSRHGFTGTWHTNEAFKTWGTVREFSYTFPQPGSLIGLAVWGLAGLGTVLSAQSLGTKWAAK